MTDSMWKGLMKFAVLMIVLIVLGWGTSFYLMREAAMDREVTPVMESENRGLKPITDGVIIPPEEKDIDCE